MSSQSENEGDKGVTTQSQFVFLYLLDRCQREWVDLEYDWELLG